MNAQEDYRMALIRQYFPASEWENAYRVMMGESGGNPGAVGDNYPIRGQTIPSYGLFQIRALPGRPSPQQLANPEANVRYASQLWKSEGWNPWTVARELGIAKGRTHQNTSAPQQRTTDYTQRQVSQPTQQTQQIPGSHTVSKGQTLWGIAQQYLGSGSRWKELGYGGDPRKMQIGTKLNIPGLA